MSRLESSSLLKFLSKPRFVYEVAEHYGISKNLASFHLRKAIKSGQVLISESPLFQTLRNSEGKLKRIGGFVYIFRNSPMFADGWEKFALREANDLISKSKGSVFSIRFLSKTQSSLGKGMAHHKLSGSTFDEKVGSRAASHFKTKGPLSSEFDVSSAKVKLAKARTVDQLLRQGTRQTPEQIKSLSHVERIRLFKALLKEPLPFLELHGRFGVSKQTIRGLVRNGLLMEVWGPKAVGVMFKPTKKGKIHVKELEAAANYELKIGEGVVIRLKHRACAC